MESCGNGAMKEVLTLLGMTIVSQPFQRKNYYLQRNRAGNFKTENIPLIGPSYQKCLLQLRDLVRCRCNPEKGCKGRCKSLSAELPCTELCLCKGD